jgi:hypothetical protein
MALQAQQIVALALSAGRGTSGYTAQAGQFLNLILSYLAQTYDFDECRKLATLTLSGSSASYSLPADYLRAREVFYYVGGTPFYLNQIPLEEYDQLFNGAGINNYPEQYATQIEASPTPLIYFWPPPNLSLSVSVRYQAQPPDILTPESSSTIPWFPNQQYLVKRLTADIAMLTDDTRHQTLLSEAAAILDRFLMIDDDKSNYSQQVQLDRRRFRNISNLKPTKVTGF